MSAKVRPRQSVKIQRLLKGQNAKQRTNIENIAIPLSSSRIWTNRDSDKTNPADETGTDFDRAAKGGFIAFSELLVW